jgi:hypothetical protein
MTIQSTGDLITLALKAAGVLGVGQTASAEDANDALSLLGMMMAQWQRRRWLVPSEVDMPITSTGAAYYTIGPIRPTTLHAAYARILPAGASPIDVSLGIITTREEYSAIALKSLSTFPAVAYLDTAWPTGRIYVWPIPPAGQFELHFVFPEAMPVWSRLTDPIDLPPEYIEALLWSLTVRLAMTYGLPPRPDHVAAMTAALHTVRVANTQIGRLSMPAGVGPVSGGGGSSSAGPAFQGGAG